MLHPFVEGRAMAMFSVTMGSPGPNWNATGVPPETCT
jgi:hypothetical protein